MVAVYVLPDGVVPVFCLHQAVGEKDVHKDQGNVMGNLERWAEVRWAGKGKNMAGRELDEESQRNVKFIKEPKETPLTETQPVSQ